MSKYLVDSPYVVQKHEKEAYKLEIIYFIKDNYLRLQKVLNQNKSKSNVYKKH